MFVLIIIIIIIIIWKKFLNKILIEHKNKFFIFKISFFLNS